MNGYFIEDGDFNRLEFTVADEGNLSVLIIEAQSDQQKMKPVQIIVDEKGIDDMIDYLHACQRKVLKYKGLPDKWDLLGKPVPADQEAAAV